MINIVDPIILLEREDMETRTNDTHIQNQIGCPKILECLILIFGIGVSCSMESPRERMNISDVVAQLHLIRDKLLRTRRRRERLQITGKLFIYAIQCHVLVTVLTIHMINIHLICFL